MDKSLYTLDFMRHTYENFPIGVFVYGDDEQGEIVYTNPRMLALCDCKNERGFRELTGGSLFGMIHKNRTLLLDDIKDQLHASKDLYIELHDSDSKWKLPARGTGRACRG